MQVSANVEVFVSAFFVVVPFRLCGPLQSPLAVQLVAFVDNHDNVELPPFAIVVGDAVSVTVGAGVFTITVTD